MKINIDKLKKDQFIHMYTSFYGSEWKELVDKFVEKGYYTPKVGAEYSDLFLNNNPDKCLQILEEEYKNASI